MNSNQAMNLFMNPFWMWSRVVWKTGEMAIASAHVIGQRSSRIALAATPPNARDQREFSLMIREKGEAGLESAQALGLRLLMLNQQVARLAFKQMLSASVALASIATSRTSAQSIERQSKLVKDTIDSSLAAASKLSGSTAQVVKRTLKPAHTRVRGNVRRFAKR